MLKFIIHKIFHKLRDIKSRIKFYITLAVIWIAETPLIVHADLNGTWNGLIEAIFPFFFKFGTLLLVFGGIEFAIAQQSEDTLQKTRALRFMIMGAVMLAVITTMKPYLLIY